MRGFSSHLRRAVAISVAVSAAGFVKGAQADPVLEEIIVTAQKREENQQDTPISLTAFGSQTLEQRGMTNVADLGNAVPNLHIMPFGVSPTTLNVYIRGVGAVDSQVTEDPPVAIYLNGVYIARPVGLGADVADIERIEVLRGPQGTLYGRNTTGGAINVITAKPVDKFGASLLVGFGNYDAVHTQAVVNLPVTDTFFVKGSFDWNKRDGWVKNSGKGRDFAGYDRQAGRIDMRWKPIDGLTVDYAYDRAKADYTADYYQLTRALPGFTFLPLQPRRVESASLPIPFQGSNDLAWGHTLTISLETGIGELKSTSAYRDTQSDSYEDYSGNPTLAIYRNDPFILNQHQVSQEFQLVGSNDAKTLDYIAGLYYFHENATQADRDVVDVAGPGVFSFGNAKALNSTYAVYGQLTWRPDAGSPWSTTLGARYTKDKRTAGNPSIANGAPFIPSASTSYDNFSPSLIVNRKLTDDINLYGKIVSGYKAGGFNLREGNFNVPFGPEKILTYELGWKTEWLMHRLRWNSAIFYSDYKDIQLDVVVPNQPNPTLTETANAGKAKISGLETELNFAVNEALRLQANYSYLYNDITRVKGDDASLWHLTAAPKNTVTATVDWDIVQLPFGTLNTTVDYSWRSQSFTTSRDVPGDGATVPAYGLTDVRLSLSGEDWIGTGTSCRVSLWVRNLTDTEWQADPLSFPIHAIKLTNYGTPRTFGLDFKVRY